MTPVYVLKPPARLAAKESEMKPTSPTSSEFLPSVLVAVAKTAGWTATNAVHWNEVLDTWKSLTGMDESSFGDDTRGYPRVLTAISTAWSSAKKKGFAAPSPRRTYLLSDSGLAYAKTLVDHEVDVPETPMVSPAASVDAASVDAAPGATGGVRFDPAAIYHSTDGDPIYEDAYFRGLAIEATSCFGRFSPRAPTCAGCPLARWCAASVIAHMASVVADLEAPAEEPVVEEPVVDATPAPADKPKGLSCVIEFEAPCEGCGEVIAEGAAAVHVPHKGVYHPHCADLVG